MTDVSLADAVAALQRMNLTFEMRQVVEEANHLLHEGKEIEARALVEKAEALWIQRSHEVAGKNPNPAASANSKIAPIAEKLAAGITAVLTSVLEDLQRYTGDQMREVAAVLEARVHGVEAALCEVPRLGQRVELLATGYEGRILALEHTREQTAGALRRFEEGGYDQRLRSVEERLGVLDGLTGELQSQLAHTLSRLDQQTDTLRSLEHRQAQRVSTLNQVIDTIARLREQETGPEVVLSATA